MRRILLFVSVLIFIITLAACGNSEWRKERGLGKEAQDSGDINQAIKHYEKAAKMNPDSEEVKKELEKAKQLYYDESREKQKNIDKKRKMEEVKKANTQPLINIEEVSDKTESEIKDLLGEPSESEEGELSFDGNLTNYKTNYYSNEKISVMFIEGKSENIRINLNDEEYLDGNDIEKNVLYIGLPLKDMSIDVAPDGQMFANSYDYDNIYRVEISRWRNDSGGFVSVILNEDYEY